MSESPFDKRVRAVLPKDHHIVLACLGGYIGLFGVFKLTSMAFGGKKKAAPAASVEAATPAATSTSGFAMPTADNISQWVEKESNWAELEKQLK